MFLVLSTQTKWLKPWIQSQHLKYQNKIYLGSSGVVSSLQFPPYYLAAHLGKLLGSFPIKYCLLIMQGPETSLVASIQGDPQLGTFYPVYFQKLPYPLTHVHDHALAESFAIVSNHLGLEMIRVIQTPACSGYEITVEQLKLLKEILLTLN